MNNNLNDKFLDQLNSSLQTNEDINTGIFKINPIANNSLGSFQLYYQRKNYEIALNNRLRDANIDYETNKDFIYKHILYGKMNLQAYPINLNDEKSKQLVSNPKVSALNIVADAYEELYNKHKAIAMRGLISKQSVFYNITPKLGYTSPNLEYSKYLNIYFNNFLGYIDRYRIKNNIINFKTLIKEFINYYNSSTDNIIFNKSEYIISSICTPLASGLIIQFANDNQGDDANKYQNYISDPSFIPFDNLIKEYGFVIDRHAPWRLVFDLQSPRASKYLQKYNINNLNEFFDQNYYLTEYFDYENMKINLLNLYNYFANKEPTFNISKSNVVNGKICISQTTIRRNIVNYADINKHISETDFLRLYFYIKNVENKSLKEQVLFNQKCNEINSIHKQIDLVTAIETIFIFLRMNKGTQSGNMRFNPLDY